MSELKLREASVDPELPGVRLESILGGVAHGLGLLRVGALAGRFLAVPSEAHETADLDTDFWFE